ncbi:MAG: penicillin-binding protein 1A, partial [Rhizobiaceae bacterium]
MFLRLFGYFFGIGTALLLLVVGAAFLYIGDLTKDLPNYDVLAQYEPPVTTRIHAADGSLMAEYARERRLYLPIQAIPDRVKQAFISAEDKNFYAHEGVDFLALGKAGFDYFEAKLSGRTARARGASTITQQVAKNFLLTKDRTADRKIKEAVLSFRIEEAYSKEKILELYLNEIFLGLGSYGVAGASLAYFDKTVGDLEIHEAAYLAALPKAPNNYHPFDDTERALDRRNWVISRMAANGYITQEESNAAQDKTLSVNPRPKGSYLAASEYFSEEVRREILDRYGEDALYEGGLSIRTTLNPQLQALARRSLNKGLIKYDHRKGYHGAFDKVEISEDWGLAFANVKQLTDTPNWDQAVVLHVDETTARVGIRPAREVSGALSTKRLEATIDIEDAQWARRLTFKDDRGTRRSATANSMQDIMARGDIVYVSNQGDDGYRLEQIPEVSGAIVAMDPHTGRVLAMIGGFSFSESQFNRATQAKR